MPPSTVREVAEALSLAAACQTLGIRPARQSLPCEQCKAPRRSKHDSRLPIGYDARLGTWKCHRCDVSGDPLGLIMWSWMGTTGSNATPQQRADFRTLLRDADLLGPEEPFIPRRQPPRRDHLRATEPEATNYPPADEVAELWRQCVPVTSDTEITRYLNLRMNDGEAATIFADMDVCRALPSTAKLPSWATHQGTDWTDSGHRLIFPAMDHTGNMVTLTARRAVEGTTPKSLPPGGYGRRGSILADPRMVALLTDPRAFTTAPGYRLRVWLVEGEMNLLAACLHRNRMAHRGGRPLAIAQSTTVAGLQSGGWSRHHSDQIPPGAFLVLTPDDDKGGDAIGAKVLQTFEHRQDVSVVWGGAQ